MSRSHPIAILEANQCHGLCRLSPPDHLPSSLGEVVDHEAMAYRAWGTPEGDFLAEQLERVSQLIRFLHASTPADYVDREEQAHCDLLRSEYERGIADGQKGQWCPR